MAAKKKSAPAAPPPASASSAPRSPTDKTTLTKIERLAQAALRTVTKGENPAVSIRTRALSNVSFNEKRRIIELGDRAQSREFFNTSMARKFMQTFLVANGCKQLIDQNKTVSIRQMFYMTKHTIKGTSENTFEEQNESDPIIEDLEVSADVLREELHLFADKKGTLAGPMVIEDSGDRIDLSRMGRGGWSIPSICEPSRADIGRMYSTACPVMPSPTASLT
jgi:DNA topoisomerase-6 subunit A